MVPPCLPVTFQTKLRPCAWGAAQTNSATRAAIDARWRSGRRARRMFVIIGYRALAAAGRFAESHESVLDAASIVAGQPAALAATITTACASVERFLGRYEDAHSRRWAGLGDLPEGTLGRGVWEFYRARGFSFPGSPGSAPVTLAQHDWMHVLADYGTTVESELEVFGFIARANNDMHAFSLLAMVVSLFETGSLAKGAGLFEASPGHLGHEGVAVRLADAMRRGALCRDGTAASDSVDFLRIDWFEVAHLTLAEARARFGMPAKSDDAVRAGSVGPWDPGGISPYQYNAGQEAAARHAGLWNPAACGSGPQQDVPLRLWPSWDPPGVDSLDVNGEWVKVQNRSESAPLALGGWWVRDSMLRRFTFPRGTVVPPGATVTVHVGAGPSSGLTFHWGLRETIFQNMGDGAYLFDPDGDLRAWEMYPCVWACPPPAPEPPEPTYTEPPPDI